jgi:hypothetical protein
MLGVGARARGGGGARAAALANLPPHRTETSEVVVDRARINDFASLLDNLQRVVPLVDHRESILDVVSDVAYVAYENNA